MEEAPHRDISCMNTAYVKGKPIHKIAWYQVLYLHFWYLILWLPLGFTPWKINMEPKNEGLEDDVPLQMGHF